MFNYWFKKQRQSNKHCSLCNKQSSLAIMTRDNVCMPCYCDLLEEVDYDNELICQMPNCQKELSEEWELEQGLCTEHIYMLDLLEIENRKHPDNKGA
ncbi:hypothetical protein CCP1ISM_50045 [Azospirillaceae bacterium]